MGIVFRVLGWERDWEDPPTRTRYWPLGRTRLRPGDFVLFPRNVKLSDFRSSDRTDVLEAEANLNGLSGTDRGRGNAGFAIFEAGVGKSVTKGVFGPLGGIKVSEDQGA